MNPSCGVSAIRRTVLTAGLSAGAALMASRADATPAALDLSTPTSRLRTYILMRGALDDRLVIGFISGRYYGVVDNEIKPLFGVVGATFSRYRLRPDGGFDGGTYEVPFFTDIETGEALQQFHNPYTGVTVDVVNSGYPPAAFKITPDLELVAPNGPKGLAMSNRVIAVQSTGPNIWITEETTSAFTLPGAIKPIRYSEVMSLHATTADIQKIGVKSVPCQTAYTSVVGWRPWLKMDDHPGHLMGTGIGSYGVAISELPENWRAAAAVRRPDVLNDLPVRSLNSSKTMG